MHVFLLTITMFSLRSTSFFFSFFFFKYTVEVDWNVREQDFVL